ncbi:hypothetical protein VPH35_053076 [Triticum aestivum]|uniref:Gamma-glutamylcyclotransferase AIG2-like domain-containing protein n=2 Tax=Triticum TaxID=4564 RepID=A0A9R1S4D6_TRITD|nr:unnamed protein product [Triticum aestivum]VAH79732.1 unnamed protein product [Triticum turgidum subsp. durum]
MDGAAHVAGDSPEADRASSSASSTDSASQCSRPRKGIHCGGGGDCSSLGEERAAKAMARAPMTTCRTSHCRRGCPSRWFLPSQRLNIRGRVYPAMLTVDGNKVPRKAVTDGEFDVLDTFEDEEYVREAVGISLTDSADTMMAYAYIWGNVDDPDLYSEWDFDVDGPADARDLGSPSPFWSSLSFLPSYRGARDQRPDTSTMELLCCCLRSSRLVLGPSHPSSRSYVLCPFFRLMFTWVLLAIAPLPPGQQGRP